MSSFIYREDVEPILRKALARAYELKPLHEGVPVQSAWQERIIFLVRAYEYLADHLHL